MVSIKQVYPNGCKLPPGGDFSKWGAIISKRGNREAILKYRNRYFQVADEEEKKNLGCFKW